MSNDPSVWQWVFLICAVLFLPAVSAVLVLVFNAPEFWSWIRSKVMRSKNE